MKKYISPTTEHMDISTIRPMMEGGLGFGGSGTGSGAGGSGTGAFTGGAPKRRVF